MKCIVCNRPFELSKEDEKKARFHEPAFCCTACFVRKYQRQPKADEAWLIHTGEVGKIPTFGSNSGKGGVPMRARRKHNGVHGKLTPFYLG